MLEAQRAVVLAETGGGKTEEFKNKAIEPQKAERCELFIPVENLFNGKVEPIIHIENNNLFKT
ncbi:MAG: hypothetical protein AAF423_14120 [Pseudomonadota bacterium]